MSSFVWEADKQNLARDVMIGVAGYPTTQTAMPCLSNSREKALYMGINKWSLTYRKKKAA